MADADSRSNATIGGAASTQSTGGATTTTAQGAAGSGPTGPGVWAQLNVTLRSSTDGLGTESYASGSAVVRDGPYPETDGSAVVMERGPCSLYKTTPISCTNPSCAAGEICVANDTCEATPNFVADFPLAFDGLRFDDGRTAVTLSTELGVSSVPNDAQSWLTYPPCVPGETVRVAGGAGLETAFELAVPCISPLPDLSSQSPLVLESGKPARITWSMPAQRTAARIQLAFGSHSACRERAYIACDAEDTGELVIDKELIATLLTYPWNGISFVVLTRYNSATAPAGSGQAELRIESMTDFFLGVPGVLGCMDTSQCPPGMTCNSTCPNRNVCAAVP